MYCLISVQLQIFSQSEFMFFCQVPTLIHDLIATEIWKKKIFPEIVLGDHEQDIIFPLYAVVSYSAHFF